MKALFIGDYSQTCINKDVLVKFEIISFSDFMIILVASDEWKDFNCIYIHLESMHKYIQSKTQITNTDDFFKALKELKGDVQQKWILVADPTGRYIKRYFKEEKIPEPFEASRVYTKDVEREIAKSKK